MRTVWVRISPSLLWIEFSEGSIPSLPTTCYGFLRCYREDKAEARMKLCQTEMVEVDLLRKQWNGLEHRPEKSCRRDRFEADWLSKKMDASPRKNRCIYLSKGRSFGSITQLVEYCTFNVGVVGSIPAWPIMILWVVGLTKNSHLSGCSSVW